MVDIGPTEGNEVFGCVLQLNNHEIISKIKRKRVELS